MTVPEGWRQQRLSELGAFLKGCGGSKKDESEAGVPVIRYGELYTQHREVIREICSFIRPDGTSAYTRLRAGDVLFTGSGETLDEIGKATVLLDSAEVYAGGDIIVFRPGKALDPRFAGYAVNSADAVGQ